MIYSISASGDNAGAKDASCAIGAGRDAAISSLVKLKHGLNSSLADTIYSVAASKFSAESKLVGKDTILCIIRKRLDGDSRDLPPVLFVEQDCLAKLKNIWKRTSKGSIPAEARKETLTVVRLTDDKEVIVHNESQYARGELEAAFKRSTSRKSKLAK
jgi:hypothetical protein